VEYHSLLKSTFPRDENLDYTNAEAFKKALIQFAYEGDETKFNIMLRNRRIVYLVNNTKNQFVKFASDFDHLYSVAPENLENEAKDIELKCFIENLRKEVLLVGEAIGCSIAAFAPLVNSAAKIDIDSKEALCEMGLKECAQKK
jgi:hypothetical protein